MTKRYHIVRHFYAETGKSAPIETGRTICLLCLLIYFRKFSFLFRWLLFCFCLFHMAKLSEIRLSLASDEGKEQTNSMAVLHKTNIEMGNSPWSGLAKVCAIFHLVCIYDSKWYSGCTAFLNTVHAGSNIICIHRADKKKIDARK